MLGLARNYFKLSVAYLVFSAFWVFIFIDLPLPFLENNLNTATAFLKGLLTNTYIGIGVLVAVVVSWAYHMRNGASWLEIPKIALLSMIGITISVAAFGLFETTYAAVMPFYADDFFASLDRTILLGNDAWVVAHALVPEFGASWVDVFYFWTWIPLVSLPPFMLLLFDRDRERVARYILLGFFSSFALGNILALIGLSVGPVYYDAYYGMTEFQGLSEALTSSGVWDSHVGKIQIYLGELFANTDEQSASDIAAFPSVHVSATMVAVLYAVERSRIIGAGMVVYVAIIWFLSVYTGYHWMVDGLASIVLMVLAQWGLRKSRLPCWLAEGKKPVGFRI